MALIALGLLFVVAAVLLARTTDNIIVADPPIGALVQDRTLLFSDGADGEVVISDAASSVIVRTLTAGEGSFIRGVVRSLVRTRHQQGLFAQTGFHLNLYEDGRLQLIDPLTGQVIDLVAFGPTNMAEFAGLLDQESGLPLVAGSR
jgi:putative photosynthetic complex assembly protein